MDEIKVEKTLKQSNKVKTVDTVEYKCYLILGAGAGHKSEVVDITDSIPDRLLNERYQYKSDSEFLNGIAASVIGIQETIAFEENGKSIEVPLTNPMGIFISIQQKINAALQAAIVNERQLNALLGIIDGIFKQCEYERELGVKHVITESRTE